MVLKHKQDLILLMFYVFLYNKKDFQVRVGKYIYVYNKHDRSIIRISYNLSVVC